MGAGMPPQVKVSWSAAIAASASRAVAILTRPHPLLLGPAPAAATVAAPGAAWPARKHLTASTRPKAAKSDLMSFSVALCGARAKNSCGGGGSHGGGGNMRVVSSTRDDDGEERPTPGPPPQGKRIVQESAARGRSPQQAAPCTRPAGRPTVRFSV
ncbi:hypothetical protein MNEG_15193, partial [Monoraphidium neglectum]